MDTATIGGEELEACGAGCRRSGNEVAADAFELEVSYQRSGFIVDTQRLLVDGGEVAATQVGGADGGNIGDSRLVGSVGETGDGLATRMGRVVEDVLPRVVGCRDDDMAALGRKLERSMEGSATLVLVAPDDGIAMGGDYRGDALREGSNLILVRVGQVIA